MAPTPRRIALFDLDGSLADYDTAMNARLKEMASPVELQSASDPKARHIKKRQEAIRKVPGFWRSLKRLSDGFDVFNMVGEVGFERHILTKGPFNTTSAWSEKVEWCRKEVPDTPVTVTEDKGLVYGRLLFDDWPDYVSRWLEWRPRGLVVMLDWPWNQEVDHPNVFRYYQNLSAKEGFEQKGRLRIQLEKAFNR